MPPGPNARAHTHIQTDTHLCRSGARKTLPNGHELDKLFFGEPLGLVHETLVEEGDVGGGATVRHDAEGKELPEHLWGRGIEQSTREFSTKEKNE